MNEKTPGFLQRRRLHILLFIFLGLLVYSNTFVAPFQFDDNIFVKYRGIEASMQSAESSDIQMASRGGPWVSRPLLYATFILNHKLGDFNTWGYHIVNIALHIVNAVLLYFLVLLTGRHLGRDEKDVLSVAVISSLIFVLHPVMTEAVTMIINRSMLMSTTFYLAGLILFLKIATAKGEKEKGYYTFGLLLTALLGSASRENFAMFPLIMFLFDLFFISRFRIRALASHYLAYLACAPGVAYLGLLVLTNSYDTLAGIAERAVPTEFATPRLLYALTQFKVQWTYIWLLLFPVNQTIEYHYPTSRTIMELSTMLAFLGYTGLWVFSIAFAKKRPLASFLVIWFLISLLPISFAVTLIGNLRLGDVIFEHRLYLPSIGLIVLGSMAFARLAFKDTRITAIFVAVCIALGATAYARNSIWTEEVKLWSDAVSKAPNSPRAHNNLGGFYSTHGEPEKGIEEFEASIRLWPGNPEAHANLGTAYLQKEEIDKGIEQMETALRLRPELLNVRVTLGMAYKLKGDNGKALEYLLEAYRLEPWRADILNRIAGIYVAQGNHDKAIEYYIKSLWLNKEQPLVLFNLGALYVETGQKLEAAKHLEPLIEIEPDFVTVRLMLGRIYIDEGHPFEAINHLKVALSLRPDNPEIHRTIAEAYKSVGNIQSANEHLLRAETLEKSLASETP